MTHSLLAVFIIGFTYSLYHCIGMCGGFVAAYSATCGAAGQRDGQRKLAQWPVHLLFNLGRVTSYSLIGVAFGFAGSWANYYGRLSGTRLQGIAGIVGGIMMILFALSLAGFLKMPAGTLLGGGVVRRWFNRLLRSRSLWRTYPLGMLVGTVPCGLVYSMSSYALASG
ncbi:MAG: sulfite exporter TauE/SafE family protein, partial [Chloroflexi bacterium]|nr:sulfite exporter TauE/SafE family protein [Chloroflexota bacterium]